MEQQKSDIQALLRKAQDISFEVENQFEGQKTQQMNFDSIDTMIQQFALLIETLKECQNTNGSQIKEKVNHLNIKYQKFKSERNDLFIKQKVAAQQAQLFEFGKVHERKNVLDQLIADSKSLDESHKQVDTCIEISNQSLESLRQQKNKLMGADDKVSYGVNLIVVSNNLLKAIGKQQFYMKVMIAGFVIVMLITYFSWKIYF